MPTPPPDNPPRPLPKAAYTRWEESVPRGEKSSSLGSLIRQLVHRLGMDGRLSESEAVLVWPEVVGAEIAVRAAAVSIEAGLLTVRVSDAAWRNELSYLKPDLIRKLNTRLGKTVVSDIKFR